MAANVASRASFASSSARRAPSRIKPGEIAEGDKFRKVEKYPEAFDIDMIRCIYCGLCEEVCPEQAIFLQKEYAITGLTRAEMVHDKEKLYEIGGLETGLVTSGTPRSKHPRPFLPLSAQDESVPLFWILSRS